MAEDLPGFSENDDEPKTLRGVAPASNRFDAPDTAINTAVENIGRASDPGLQNITPDIADEAVMVVRESGLNEDALNTTISSYPQPAAPSPELAEQVFAQLQAALSDRGPDLSDVEISNAELVSASLPKSRSTEAQISR
jgi:hypothetical protein